MPPRKMGALCLTEWPGERRQLHYTDGPRVGPARGPSIDHQKKCPKDYNTVLRAAPTGASPPMGQQQLTGSRTPAARTPRFPPRECHRKGCGLSFLPLCLAKT